MKSFLNTRQYDILTILLKDDCPRTVGEVANALGIHPRVIQYNLNAVDAWLESHEAKVIRRSGVGLHIDLSQQQREALLRQLSALDNIELVLSTRQRRRCILLRMLSSEQPISSVKLATEFGISPTTVISDVVEVQLELQKFHLEMARTPHKGFHIEGRRSLKRFAMCALYCEEHIEGKVPPGDMLKLTLSRPPFDYLASQWFDPGDVELAGKAIRKAEQALKTQYAHASRTFLHYYILLLLTDLRRGSQVTRLVAASLEGFRESIAVATIRSMVERHTREQVNEAELELLALHLHCLSAFERPNVEGDGKPRKSSDPSITRETIELGEALIKEIALFLHPYLQVDQAFRAEIIAYLDRCLPYRQLGFTVLNPFQQKVRAAFSETYDIIERICSKNERFIEDPLSESDISALSVITTNALERIPQITQRNIRVALISEADETLTMFTRERILSKFPWFRMVGVFRAYDPQRLRPGSVDLILSTSESDARTGAATIAIDPFLTDADVEHIESWMNQNVIQKGSKLGGRGAPGLKDLLCTQNILVKESVHNWEEAVYVAGGPLVQSGDLSRSYLDAIIRVGKQYGPYSVVSPHIALLHAKPTDGVRNLCAGLMILKDGIAFGAPKFDPVDLVFVLGIPDSRAHLRTLEELADLIRSRGVCERLRRCNSAEEAIEVLVDGKQRAESRE